MKLENKRKLYQYCMDNAKNKISSIQQSISEIQDAANSETKSTAGDKHDTARAMMQIDVEYTSKQLMEAQKLMTTLYQIQPDKNCSIVQLGALVSTNSGDYYIAISIGKVSIESNDYWIISPSSPIGSALLGLKKGDTTTFNGCKFKIEAIV